MNPPYRRSAFIPLLRLIFSNTPMRLNDAQRRLLASADTSELMEFIISYMTEYAAEHPNINCLQGLLPPPAMEGDDGADHPPVVVPAADATSAAVDSREGTLMFLMVDGGTSPS